MDKYPTGTYVHGLYMAKIPFSGYVSQHSTNRVMVVKCDANQFFNTVQIDLTHNLNTIRSNQQ